MANASMCIPGTHVVWSFSFPVHFDALLNILDIRYSYFGVMTLCMCIPPSPNCSFSSDDEIDIRRTLACSIHEVLSFVRTYNTPPFIIHFFIGSSYSNNKNKSQNITQFRLHRS